MTTQQIRARQAEIAAAGGVPAAVVMAPGSKALSEVETKTLLECEAVIHCGLQAFDSVGAALMTIRDKRLYRFKFATFEEYCRERWGWTARRARQVCDATSVVTQIRDAAPEVPPPSNERQARALAAVPEADRPEVWKKVVAEAPKDSEGKPRVTARAVEREAVSAKGKGQSTEEDLVPRLGDIVQTNYGTGPYRVVNVTAERGSFHFTVVPEDAPITADGGHRKKDECYLNNYRVRDGALQAGHGDLIRIVRRVAREEAQPVHPEGTTENLDLNYAVLDARVDVKAVTKLVEKFQHRLGPSDELRAEMQKLFDLAKALYKVWMERTSEWDCARSEECRVKSSEFRRLARAEGQGAKRQGQSAKRGGGAQFLIVRQNRTKAGGDKWYRTAAGGWSTYRDHAQWFGTKEEAQRFAKSYDRIVAVPGGGR